MITVYKKHFAISGHVGQADMVENIDTKQIHFKMGFQQAGYASLSFETEAELFKYLDESMPGHKILLAGDKLWYPLSENDRSLEYFGSISY